MTIIKKLNIVFFILLISLQAKSQLVLDRQVIGSTGSSASIGNWNIDYTIGEPVIETTTKNAITLTQGFHQPVNTLSGEKPHISYEICRVSDSIYNISYLITGENNTPIVLDNDLFPQPLTVFPPNTYLINNLIINKSIFPIEILATNQFGADSVSIFYDSVPFCDPILYHGFTPNDDTYNDKWIIDGIDSRQVKVTILNRWGEVVWYTKNDEYYDNVNVVWDGNTKDSKTPLPDGTYFYIVKIKDKVYKSWVELTR